MIFLYIAGGLLLFTLALSYFAYRQAFFSPKAGQNSFYNIPKGEQYQEKRAQMRQLIEEMEKLPFESVKTKSHDGLPLAARYYEVAEGAPLAICFHGYRGSGVRDFCGGARIAMAAGYNVLLVDQRAHGKSGGHTISFGIRERRDVLTWVNFAISRFGQELPIALCGISMGASTVLMASALPLPSNVRGITADCPYSSPRDIIRKVCDDHRLPTNFLYPFICLGALLFGRFRPGAADACTAVGKTTLPILLIHGEEDRLVPYHMAKAIKAENPAAVRLEIFKGAGHGISYMQDYERYCSLLAGFLRALVQP